MGVIGKQIFEKGPKFCGSTMNLNSMCLITASVIINSSKHEKKKSLENKMPETELYLVKVDQTI